MPNKSQARVNTQRTAYKSRAGTNPRSRWGCVTCKAKHTKCDETRPECLRCTRSGVKCGGYWRQFKWSFKHQPSSVDRPSSPDCFTVITTPGSLPGGSSSYGRPGGRRDSRAKEPNYADESVVGDHPSPFSIALPSPGSKSCDHDTQSISGGRQRSPSWSGTDLSSGSGSASLPQAATPMLARENVVRRDQQDDHNSSSPHSPFFTPGKDAYQSPVFTTPVTDTSSQLISTWFEHVCPAWNGFDSDSNLNRKLAVDFWQGSLSVFSTMQCMSAAFLSSRLPYMRQPALRLMHTATESILNEVRLVKSGARPDAIPTGLLFSLFALGTTVCWIDANQLGLPFLREAKFLLDQINRQSLLPIGAASTSASRKKEDADILAFFNRSLAYCEMLLAVVSDNDPLTDLDEILPARPRPAAAASGTGYDGPAHPWTGISTITSHLFARSVRLCRNYRRDLRRYNGNDRLLRRIREAERLEEQLLELEFPTDLPADNENQNGNDNGTGDLRTPLLHLARIAEAYQLASLLHLYQTFPDLVTLRLPSHYFALSATTPAAACCTPWREWIVPLSFRLIRVLEQIPPYSGSRVIQPLLYISAGTGLRYVSVVSDVVSAAQSGIGMMGGVGTSASGSSSSISTGLADPMAQSLWDDFGIPTGPGFSPGGTDTNSSGGSDSNSVVAAAAAAQAAPGTIVGPSLMSRESLDVSNARHFVMMRLAMLEHTLPPNPVIVARELVKAIWDAYDAEMLQGSTAVHWVDVMEDRNLRSMFG